MLPSVLPAMNAVSDVCAVEVVIMAVCFLQIYAGFALKASVVIKSTVFVWISTMIIYKVLRNFASRLAIVLYG